MCETCLRGNCTVYFSSYYYKRQHIALINRGYRVCSCFFYRYSIILLAVVDHRYCFRYINVRAPGRRHDAYVYGRSWLCQKIERGLLSFPVAIIIEHYPVKPIILCDQAFPLTENLLKPFPSASPRSTEAIFNYNLSKTRGIVENAFGRLKARFRFTMKRMECKLANAQQAIKTACILHNICKSLRDAVEQHWEQDAQTFQALYKQPFHTTTVSTGQGEEVRQALDKYFWNRARRNTLPSWLTFCAECSDPVYYSVYAGKCGCIQQSKKTL